MANRPLSPEQIQELESAISKKEVASDNNASEIDRAIQKEEDRSLAIEQTKSIKELTAELHFFNTEVYPLMKDYEGLTLNINPKKIRDDISGELQPIPKELADMFLLHTKDKISYLKSLDTHIRITKLWGNIIGLSLFWLVLFFVLIACLNYYMLHLPQLTTFIWTLGMMWAMSIVAWVYVGYKIKM